MHRGRRTTRGRGHDLDREPDAGNPHVRFNERGEETWLGGKVSEAPTDGESRRHNPKTATASWLRSTRLSSTLLTHRGSRLLRRFEDRVHRAGAKGERTGGDWRETASSGTGSGTLDGAACGSEGSRGPLGCDGAGSAGPHRPGRLALAGVPETSGRGRADVRCPDGRGWSASQPVGGPTRVVRGRRA